MRNLAAICSVLVCSIAATASETKIFSAYCYDQYYVTFPSTAPKPGSWLTGMGRLINVNLRKDPTYPNANEPRTHWIGTADANVNGAAIELNIEARELDSSVTFVNRIDVTIDEITAESEGGSYIRAALKTKDKSAGLICNEMTLK